MYTDLRVRTEVRKTNNMRTCSQCKCQRPETMFSSKSNGKQKKSCDPCLQRIQQRRTERRLRKFKTTKHIRKREAKVLSKFYTLPTDVIRLIYEYDSTYHEVFSASLFKIELAYDELAVYRFKPKWQRLFGDEEYYVTYLYRSKCRVSALHEDIDIMCNRIMLTWPKVRTMMEVITDEDHTTDVEDAIRRDRDIRRVLGSDDESDWERDD